jgi:hypothetical protein
MMSAMPNQISQVPVEEILADAVAWVAKMESQHGMPVGHGLGRLLALIRLRIAEGNLKRLQAELPFLVERVKIEEGFDFGRVIYGSIGACVQRKMHTAPRGNN